MLIPRRPNFSKLAVLPVLCASGLLCHHPMQEGAQESATTAEVLLAEAATPRTLLHKSGFALAAADSRRSDPLARGCAIDLQCRLRRTGRPGRDVHWQTVSLPATFSVPSGTYRLEFNTTHQSGAWDPSLFAVLLSTDEMKNKSLVSQAPLSGYGGRTGRRVVPSESA